jgi:trimeric autotransporter adhesin
MRNLRNCGLLAVIMIAFGFAAVAQNVNVNPGAGSYPTLADAFTAINAGTHTGAVTISVVGDTSEPAAGAILNASGSGAASYSSIVMNPVGARTISGTATSGLALVDFNGSDNVTIDGLNDGTNTLTIQNLNALSTSGTSTIRFFGGATGNTITNANINGSASMSVITNGGTIYFATDAVTANGNDNNTISNNNIGPAGANLPTKGIYGNGSTTTTAIGNSGNIINNNNILDFFGAAVTSSGITTQGGCNTWSITNNRFYQTGTRTWTTGATHRAIDINSSTTTSGAQGFTITGNIVGYASNTQTGTYTMTGSTGKFQGIVVNAITGGVVSNVNNNTVASVSVTGVTSSGTTSASPLLGMYLQNGVVIANNNNIGSQNTTGSLVLSTNTTTTTEVLGIYGFPSDVFVSNNNNIGGISVTNAAASGTFTITGMRANLGTTLTHTATGNNIGGTIANSIQLNATGVSSQIIGMISATSISNYSLNNIRNLTTNIGTGTSGSASVLGIYTGTSLTPNHTISQNTISNLTNTNATAASVVTGIQFTGGTANLIQRNLITGLAVATNSTAAEVNGIRIAGGTTVYRNNMINVGVGIPNAIGTGNSTGGVNGIFEFLGTNTFTHNSVYVGGAPTAGVGPSYAFNGQQTSNTRAFRDNIFFNARSNAGATGANYAVRVGGSAPNPGGLTVNNNVYFANGTGGVFGFFNNLPVANLAAWQTAVGQDAASFEANPLFVSPTDLHLQAGSPAIDVAFNLSVPNDFDGDSRPGTNALYDIGADERDGIPAVANDMAATAFIDPTNAGSKLQGATFSPQASFTNNGTAAQTNVTVRYRICSDITCTTVIYNNTFVIPSIATLATTPVTFPSTSIATAGTYYIRATAELVGDLVAANDEIAGSFQVLAPLAGTYTVGAGGNYPSLTNNGGIFQAINNLGVTSNVTISVTSDMAGELGTNALNAVVSGFTVSIKPAVGVSPVISGSAPVCMITLNGVSGTMIDGSNTVGGTTKDMTFSNTNTAGSTVCFQNAATSNTVKNSILRGVSTASNGVVFFSTVATGIIGNSNNTVENNDISGGATATTFGVFNSGTTAAKNSTNLIARNRIFDFSTTGIRDNGNSAGNTYLQNEIFEVTTQTTDLTGFRPSATNIDGFTFSRNFIHDLNTTSTGTVLGIHLFDTSTVATSEISNNMITLSAITPLTLRGIYDQTATGEKYNLFYNSVFIGGAVAGLSNSESYNWSIPSTTTVQNNIFVNARTGGTGKHYAYRTNTTLANLTSDFNDIYVTGGTGNVFGNNGTADVADLVTWRLPATVGTGKDASSVSADPLFVSTSNLHLSPSSTALVDKGTPVSVLVDFDGQVRSVVGLVGGIPDIGADEYVAPTAASASVRGRLVSAFGRNLANAGVSITNTSTGETRYTRSNQLGFFNFPDLQTGIVYVVSVQSKRFVFANHTFTLNEDFTDLVLTAQANDNKQ